MSYKSITKKIAQRKKYILFFAALLPMMSVYAQESRIELDDSIYIKGYKCKSEGCEPINIGVEGVSYMLLPAQGYGDDFLSFYAGKLKLAKDNISKESLFSFSSLKTEDGLLHYSLQNVDYGRIKNNHKDRCFINVISEHQFHLLFREHEYDMRPSFLKYNVEKKLAAFVGLEPLRDDDNLLVVKPVYDFLNLDQKDIDKKTWLFKIPKKEKISNKTLSVSQIQALYALKYGDDSSKQFAVAHEDENFIYAYTDSLYYCTQGLSIQSVESQLKISDIKHFYKIIKDSSGRIEEINKINDGLVELERGKILTLIPDYSNKSHILPSFGDITITPGKGGKYDKRVAFKLERLLESKNLFRPDYFVEFDGDVIQIIDADSGFFTTTSGKVAFLVNKMSEAAIVGFGGQAYKVVDRLAEGIERHGKDLESSSEKISESLEKISERMQYSVEALSNSIDFAMKTFKNTTKFMSNKMSDDMKHHIPIILKSLKEANTLLGNNLKEVSKTLSEGARDAMEKAGKSFENAFEELSTALKDSSGNMSEAVIIASKNIKEAMNEVKEGLGNIDIQHRWSIWNLFGF